MLPMKLDLTEELAATLRQLRLDHPVDGKILTAENLSKAIGNNRAWMSQVESRRLKKIKREDIIKIYKLLYNYDDDKAEYLAEHDLEPYYLDNDNNVPLRNSLYENLFDIAESEEDIEKSYEVDDDAKKVFAVQIDNLFECLYDKFRDLQSGKDRMDFFDFLQSLMVNIDLNLQDTIKIYSAINMELLKYANQNEYEEIMSNYSVLADKIKRFEPRRLIDSLENRIELIGFDPNNYNILPYEIKQSLLYGLVELSQIISYDDFDNSQKIHCINSFIDVTRNFYINKCPDIPFTISNLNPVCSKDDMLNAINNLQLLLSDANSRFAIRGKISSYYNKKDT